MTRRETSIWRIKSSRVCQNSHVFLPSLVSRVSFAPVEFPIPLANATKRERKSRRLIETTLLKHACHRRRVFRVRLSKNLPSIFIALSSLCQCLFFFQCFNVLLCAKALSPLLTITLFPFFFFFTKNRTVPFCESTNVRNVSIECVSLVRSLSRQLNLRALILFC